MKQNRNEEGKTEKNMKTDIRWKQLKERKKERKNIKGEKWIAWKIYDLCLVFNFNLNKKLAEF